jgi:uncharacterized protein YecT (DUF1311 family)
MPQFIFLFLAVLFPTLSFSAGFDCAKAQSKVELLICADPELSALDSELNTAYRQALQQSKHSQQITQVQRRWVKEVRNVCTDALCLKSAYTVRMRGMANSAATPEVLKKGLKETSSYAPIEPREFIPFIKEQESSDAPYEMASPEAERLLKFIEAQQLTGHSPVTEMFSDGLKHGDGEYLKITKDVFIVTGGWNILLADMHTSQFKRLWDGYNIEVVDNGVLHDGTGWILAESNRLSHGSLTTGFQLISYLVTGEQANVVSTPLVFEWINGDSPDEDWCGIGEDKVKDGITGRILGHEWKDLNKDRKNELVFSVEERDCGKAGAPAVKRQRAFSITNGQVNEIK